jgi:hypothetical protein
MISGASALCGVMGMPTTSRSSITIRRTYDQV